MFQVTSKHLTFALLVIIAASGYLLFNSYRDVTITHNQAKHTIEEQQTKHKLVTNMFKAARERSILLLTMHATDDLFEMDDLNQQLGHEATKFIAAREELMAMDLNPEERTLLEEQMSLVSINAPLQNQAAELFLEGQRDEAEALLFNIAIPGQRTVLNKTDDILDFYEKTARKVIADIEAREEKANTNFQRLAAALLITGFLLALFNMRTTRHEKERLIQSAEEMSYQARHDKLTGLLNRRGFEAGLSRMLDSLEPGQTNYVFYMDLDQFKIVNDTGGHHVGDELLRQVAEIMRSCIRKTDVLARIGGDEFGTILETCDLACATKIADTIIDKLEEYRCYWKQNTFRVGVSIGMVEVSSSKTRIADVMKHIDSACYAAKDSGGNRYHVYTESDAGLIHRKSEMDWIIHIESALELDRLVLHAQPIVPSDVSNPEINYEFLVRMNTEDNGLVAAGVFLPAAERYNKIIKIDRWVLSEALAKLSANPQFLRHVGYCSINLSTQSLTDQQFLAFATEKFNEHKELTEKICFEITETAAISNLVQAKRCISKLKNIGVRFSLDDFGSGLASFEYLKTLPIDFLKIDGMFIRDIVSDPIDHAMVKSIHEVGSVMGKTTVAEFVENEDILNEVRKIGIHYVQGYHVGKPVPIEEVLGQDERLKVKG